jgi:hypothetical protein
MALNKEYNKSNIFRNQLQLILIAPINKAIRQSGMGLMAHCVEINKRGFKITYKGLSNSLRGVNWGAYKFDYYFKLYEYFNINLDVNTFSQLLSDSIEFEKKYRLNKPDKRYKKTS